MPYISVEYEYNLPNEYLVDHNQDQGNKRTTTYDGPDKIYLIVDNETGKEAFGPVTEEDLSDGRPLPLGCRYVEVDCSENPLICQLRAPVIDEQEEVHTGETGHRLAPDVPGYFNFRYATPLLPKDVYDWLNITVSSDNVVTAELKTINEALYGRELPTPTWDDIRRKRTYDLKHSDGATSADMPQSILDAWAEYRQLLRDLPDKLGHIDPKFVIKMFPENPHAGEDPINNDPKF